VRPAGASDWLLLTKRAGALARLIPAAIRTLPNVWPGVTCGHPASIWRAEKLVALECAGPKWVSAEPLLGPLELRRFLSPERSGLAWVIAGGQSGPGHRAMELGWIQDLADQCETTGAPIFIKQDSGPKPRKQGRIPDALWAQKQWPAGGGRSG
jgi:protein gp37